LAAALDAKRADLRALDDDTSSARAAVELDQSRVGRLSRMGALQGQAQEQQRRWQQGVIRIGSALERIAEGEYGWCLKCGEAIAEARLVSDPAMPLCIDCAT
jgi:DnaK suppressor protein